MTIGISVVHSDLEVDKTNAKTTGCNAMDLQTF